MVKILVIDDDRMNCDLLQAVLTRHGYDVHSATSGLEGLNLFRQHNPRVTILDLRMPEMDGLTVLKEIRAIDPQAPVIILGGGATEVQENQARALRVTDFVRKGLSPMTLVVSGEWTAYRHEAPVLRRRRSNSGWRSPSALAAPVVEAPWARHA